MNVIVKPADLQGGHFVFSRNAADVGPDPLFDLRRQMSDAAC